MGRGREGEGPEAPEGTQHPTNLLPPMAKWVEGTQQWHQGRVKKGSELRAIRVGETLAVPLCRNDITVMNL